MLKFECMTGESGELEFSVDAGADVRRLARQALLRCDSGECVLTWGQIKELAQFSVDELSKGARHAIDCTDVLIAADRLEGSPPRKKYENESDYINDNGADTVLDDWLAQKDGPDWHRLTQISPSLSNIQAMAAFALWNVDQALLAQKAKEYHRAMELLCIVSGALSTAFFFTGWLEGMRISDEKRREDGQRGATKTNAPKSKLRKWVVDAFQAGSWPSPYRASFVLAPLAIAKAPEFQTVLSSQRAQTTIYEWLRAAGREGETSVR
ncbi:hypothetical protein CR105_16075 [Massilia eurypsychrophila]|uniref:Uncharacterized protein n=1 Tax=Massilia eurypsychrophila TaxID=1485217 RepID=A0A2G8TE04_9BURK|nr:hypothetical protein [Massilia eurypsychrophila]PIL43868.1 hypothetical protein CR105_16075 [Massilia eurypsychrophila]